MATRSTNAVQHDQTCHVGALKHLRRYKAIDRGNLQLVLRLAFIRWINLAERSNDDYAGCVRNHYKGRIS